MTRGVALVGALLAAAALTSTAEARAWTPFASGGMHVSDQVGLARTSDGVLHVAWRREAAAQDLLATSISPDGTVGAPVTAVGGWAGIGSPALVARGSTLSAFFPGTQTLTTGDPTYGLDLATSVDGGASWAVGAAAIARGDFAFARTPSAVLTQGGAYLQSWYGADETVVHPGLDPAVPAVSGYGRGTDQALAAADDGQVMAAWCDASGGVVASRGDPATGARIGDVLALPDTGRCGADSRVAIASNGDVAAQPMDGEPYFFVAASSADEQRVRFFVISEGRILSTSTLAGGTSAKQQIAIATQNTGIGSVWVCWRDSDTEMLGCRRYSNPSARPSFAFGAQVDVPLPAGQTPTQLALSAQPDRVDAVATASDDANVVGLFATQVFPGLTLEAGNAKKLATKGFRVLDDQQPVRDATVKVGGQSLTTDKRGFAKVQLRPGRYTATASKARYADATVRLRIG